MRSTSSAFRCKASTRRREGVFSIRARAWKCFAQACNGVECLRSCCFVPSLPPSAVDSLCENVENIVRVSSSPFLDSSLPVETAFPTADDSPSISLWLRIPRSRSEVAGAFTSMVGLFKHLQSPRNAKAKTTKGTPVIIAASRSDVKVTGISILSVASLMK